jgi:basic amino acid/polyamine antiporter, APA family
VTRNGAILHFSRPFPDGDGLGNLTARVFARLHPRFRTPAVAILFYALTGWALAASGSFLWIVGLSSGSMIILYAGVCASLIRLQKLRPNAEALRIPFGPLLSVLATAISLALMTGLKRRELSLISVTALFATANWLWARRNHLELETKAKAVAIPLSRP